MHLDPVRAEVPETDEIKLDFIQLVKRSAPVIVMIYVKLSVVESQVRVNDSVEKVEDHNPGVDW